MLKGTLGKEGYDWWWHSFTAYHKVTGEPKSFFIEYFIINPKLNPKKVVLGQLPEHQNQGIKPSYVMIKAGCWGKDAVQLHGFYPTKELKIHNRPLSLEVGSCKLSETSMCGRVNMTRQQSKKHPEYMSDAGMMQWNLNISKQITFNVGYGASKVFRKLNAFEMYWHAEGMKTQYKGAVILNGEEYEVIPEKSYGYADKNWGKDFTSPWLWLGCSHIIRESDGKVLENSALDIGGGCPKVFGISLKRKLLMNFFYEGKDTEYNFSKPWLNSRVVFRVEQTEKEVIWKIIAQDMHALIKLKVICKKEEMLNINYEAPNGKKLHNRLWNGGTGEGQMLVYNKQGKSEQLQERFYLRNVGCEYGEYSH